MSGEVALWILLIGLATFEIVATLTGSQTISEAIWSHEKGRWWLRVAIVGLLALLAVHLVLKPDAKIPQDDEQECSEGLV